MTKKPVKPKKKPLMPVPAGKDKDIKTQNATMYARKMSGTSNKKDPKYVDAYNEEMNKPGYKKGGKVKKPKKK